ncbi:MAG: antitoxin VapB family protein [Verrucomicrobiota bacterium]
MATKTISIDMEAYERLRSARLSEKESFPKVIHRAMWESKKKTCGALLSGLREDSRSASNEVLRKLEEAQVWDAEHPPQSFQEDDRETP